MENKKYIAVLHQDGGCDYTIECGTSVINLNSTNMEDSKVELEERISEEYTDESSLTTAVIYEVSDVHKLNVTGKGKKEIY